MSFVEFVSWVLYSGGAGTLVSSALEKWAWFHKQTSSSRWWIAKTLVVGVALGLYWVVTNAPADFLVQLDVYFKIATGALITSAVVEVYHNSAKEDQPVA